MTKRREVRCDVDRLRVLDAMISRGGDTTLGPYLPDDTRTQGAIIQHLFAKYLKRHADLKSREHLLMKRRQEIVQRLKSAVRLTRRTILTTYPYMVGKDRNIKVTFEMERWQTPGKYAGWVDVAQGILDGAERALNKGLAPVPDSWTRNMKVALADFKEIDRTWDDARAHTTYARLALGRIRKKVNPFIQQIGFLLNARLRLDPKSNWEPVMTAYGFQFFPPAEAIGDPGPEPLPVSVSESESVLLHQIKRRRRGHKRNKPKTPAPKNLRPVSTPKAASQSPKLPAPSRSPADRLPFRPRFSSEKPVVGSFSHEGKATTRKRHGPAPTAVVARAGPVHPDLSQLFSHGGV